MKTALPFVLTLILAQTLTGREPPGARGGAHAAELGFHAADQEINVLAARGVALADFNGDGHPDAWFVNEGTADGEGQRLYLNSGTGVFADSGQRFPLNGFWNGAPAVGDVDGNGAPDVVVTDTVWVNDGAGRFVAGSPMVSSDGDAPSLGQLADFDGDGDLDFAGVVKWREWRVWLNDGRGHFLDTGTARGSGMIGALAAGDVNADGAADVFTAGWTMSADQSSPNQMWLNDGRGGFTPGGAALALGEHHVHGAALGDLDADGDLDLVLALTTPGLAGRVYLNTGDGSFSETDQSLGDRWAHAVCLGDMDGDGTLDVFLACGDPKTGTPNQAWLNDGRGRFRDSGLRLGHAFSWSAALGDGNHDGRADAVVANLRLVDDTKGPPIFGGAPAEIWLSAPHLAAPGDAVGESPAAEAVEAASVPALVTTNPLAARSSP